MNSILSIFLVFICLTNCSNFLFVNAQYSFGPFDKQHCDCKPVEAKEKSSNIIERANENDLKWMASIFEDKLAFSESNVLSKRIIRNLCTAIVINSFTLLTAASCFPVLDEKNKDEYKKNYFVGFSTDHNATKAYLPEEERVGIEDVKFHSDYLGGEFDKGSHGNNIALVQTTKQFKLGIDVFAACLLQTRSDLKDDNFILASYSNHFVKKPTLYKYLGSNIDLYREDELFIDSYKQNTGCNQIYNNLNDSKLICASSETNIFCGNLGGVLHSKIGNSMVVVGILTNELNCSDLSQRKKPAIFLRIENYFDWIEALVGDYMCMPERIIQQRMIGRSVDSESISNIFIYILVLLLAILVALSLYLDNPVKSFVKKSIENRKKRDVKRTASSKSLKSVTNLKTGKGLKMSKSVKIDKSLKTDKSLKSLKSNKSLQSVKSQKQVPKK